MKIETQKRRKNKKKIKKDKPKKKVKQVDFGFSLGDFIIVEEKKSNEYLTAQDGTVFTIPKRKEKRNGEKK